jgi:hypothetical protein
MNEGFLSVTFYGNWLINLFIINTLTKTEINYKMNFVIDFFEFRNVCKID